MNSASAPFGIQEVEQGRFQLPVQRDTVAAALTDILAGWRVYWFRLQQGKSQADIQLTRDG